MSPERELYELSVLPWRLMADSFLVILAAGSAALPDATRLRVLGVGVGDSCCCWGCGRSRAACAGGPDGYFIEAGRRDRCTWGGAGRERG